MDEDKLTPEEVQAIRAGMLSEDVNAVLRATDVPHRLVAEGDSWFDYAPGLDILMQLRRRHGYRVYTVAKAGDTLENMAFGTQIDRNFRRRLPPLLETLQAIERHRPRILLLSGGGNDFAGSEFEGFLNHRDTGLTPLRETHLGDVLEGTFRKAYQHIVDTIWRQSPAVHIVCHGYGYPVPDGRGVINLPFGFRFVGPWLRPPLVRKNITALQEGTEILRKVIDVFNGMLADFAATDERIHYIDLRNMIAPGDWVNELHLKNSAYARVADQFHQRIEAILAD